ncbi:MULTISPECIES: NAD(P)H-hydrate dehydratase [unclassified Ruegeria]|uniref:NAD(P)H-hydrate dehydratase n=1 Tax=unclassified Ruegeria TaxID=2625375 RepID=UPI001AEABB5B|nr:MULTISPECIES: NAD(P)H-hydrate dehydratase [unclassified Ruegeria]
MTELLTAAQMRAIEHAAIESGDVTGLDLMERAGQGVVEAIFEEWPELVRRGASPSRSPEYLAKDEEDPLRAVVLCGPGNNGGDGFVVARLLLRLGWKVKVFLYGDPDRLPPDARMNYERWNELGDVIEFSKESLKGDHLAGFGMPDVLVDAIFGSGLTRQIDPVLGQSLKFFFSLSSHVRFVAVDSPSGLCMDSGKVLGARAEIFTDARPLSADLTVTFERRKLGHVLSDGPAYCGKVIVAAIGLNETSERHWRQVELQGEGARRVPVRGIDLNDIAIDSGRRARAVLTKQSHLPSVVAHKYTHGHALILSGGPGKTGAARLAARGALRIGAGLVTLGVPSLVLEEVASQITALMLQCVDGSQMLSDVLQDVRMNALCLGPGLGLERARDLVPVALIAKRATALDADALTAFAGDPENLFEMLHDRCVLTPHGGEFARLFPDLAEKLSETPVRGPAYSKVDATREAAARAGCVVLFKGPDTVIAAPDGRCSINAACYDRAAPWLATAGSGDVLAGYIAGLLARGFDPMTAAETAAWLHVECARLFGPGLIAEDLPEQLPGVFKQLNI